MGIRAEANVQMFGLKSAFDPQGLLNPGKRIPTLNRCAEHRKLLVRGAISKPPVMLCRANAWLCAPE